MCIVQENRNETDRRNYTGLFVPIGRLACEYFRRKEVCDRNPESLLLQRDFNEVRKEALAKLSRLSDGDIIYLHKCSLLSSHHADVMYWTHERYGFPQGKKSRTDEALGHHILSLFHDLYRKEKLDGLSGRISRRIRSDGEYCFPSDLFLSALTRNYMGRDD